MPGAVAGTGTGTGIGSRSASSVRLMRVAYLQALPNQLLSCCFKPTEKPLNANTYSGIDKARMEEERGEKRGEDRREIGIVVERERRGQEMCAPWQLQALALALSLPLSLSPLMRLIICANK